MLTTACVNGMGTDSNSDTEMNSSLLLKNKESWMHLLGFNQN
jgi:hypothetical protein